MLAEIPNEMRVILNADHLHDLRCRQCRIPKHGIGHPHPNVIQVGDDGVSRGSFERLIERCLIDMEQLS